ncbi:MAG: hypothetical protein ACFE0J_06875 [Elainellaceae cyanobacterium]
MSWPTSLDWTTLLHSLAQTPTPDELLQQQMELLQTLREENRSLSESFKTYVSAMQFVLVVFAFLGGVIAYIFGKNLNDAKQIARELIDQEVNRRIVTIVGDEINYLKRVLGRERVIGEVLMDYYHPDESFAPREIVLLETRGFRRVRRCTTEHEIRRSPGHIVVMDLGHWPEADGRTFDDMKEAVNLLPDDEQRRSEHRRLDDLARERVEPMLSLLPKTSALIVYTRANVRSLNPLKGGAHPFGIANMPITLVGMVSDAAYVVYAEQT